MIRILIVAAILLLQAAIIEAVTASPRVVLEHPLADLPQSIGPWNTVSERRLTDNEERTLRADQVLLRQYEKPASPPLELLIAYFEAQTAGRSPHSPKNCLPGSGWQPVESSIVQVSVEGADATIPVNRYLLANHSSRIAMYYWYQSGRRAVASEYLGKLFLVGDALLHHRTESAIVRVSAPLRHAADNEAEQQALAFIRQLYPALRRYFPQQTRGAQP